ncbi:polysaccharide pyruvyl transferase family protein [Citromicrobium bathyomarinum]|uniref:polysaccharide pyruvyl transferase family protein n=1 Tax=Citromicrobium bathyomarinum TaxID=72174 RepID=UPI00315A8446
MSLKTQYENLGDLVINAVLAAELNRRGRFLGISNGAPADYVDDFQALAEQLSGAPITCGELRQMAPRILQAAAGSGMTLVLSPGHNTLDQPTRTRQILSTATHYGLGRLRILQVGASFEGAFPETTRLYSQLRKAGHPLSVRDIISRNGFAERGINLPIVPDLAFGLQCSTHNEGDIGLIAVREHKSQPYEQLRKTVAAIAVAMHAVQLEPVMFFQVSLDAPLHARLAYDLGIRELNTGNHRPSFDEAMQVYARAGAIVSNRLHGLLVAAAAGALPLPLLHPEERKIRGALAEGELSGLIIEAEPECRKRTGELLARRSELHNRIVVPAFARCKQQLEDFFDGATG